jgi:hypothetical protein
VKPSIGTIARVLFFRAGWAPALVLGVHYASAWVIGIYAIFPHFDVPVHFVGGVSVAFLFRATFAALPTSLVQGRGRAVLEATFVMGLTSVAAVFWEFFEFLSDRYLGSRMQVGLPDTLLDLAMGVLGGLVVVLVAWARGLLGRVRPIDG